METLSPYARQFLPTLPRPDVDAVIGVPPSIALEQRTTRGGANSTVATVTEVAHYLRLLYAKVGDAALPEVRRRRRAELAGRALRAARRSRDAAKRDRVRARGPRAQRDLPRSVHRRVARGRDRPRACDGAIVGDRAASRGSRRAKEHTIDLIVHYGPLAALDRETFDRALAWGGRRAARGRGRADGEGRGDRGGALDGARVPECGTGVPELDPRWFSFNTKQGQCEACEGTGVEGGPDGGRARGARRRAARAGARASSAVPRRVRLHGETYAELTARDVASALERARAWKFDRERGAHRQARRTRSSSAASRSWSRSGSATSRSTARRRRSPAARCSAFGSRRSSAAGSPARSTCSTSRRSACTRATRRRSSRNLRALVDGGLDGARRRARRGDDPRGRPRDRSRARAAGANGGHIVAEGPRRDGPRRTRARPPRARSPSRRASSARARPLADRWIELVGRARRTT